jgi:predicted transcriptional regulator
MPRPTLSDPLTLRMPTDVLEAIEAIAETCDRSRSWVMVRAMRLYLAREGAEILAVRQGRAEAANGDVHDMETVLSELEGIIGRKVA